MRKEGILSFGLNTFATESLDFFVEDVLGKMQMALGVVACCSFILFIQSCGLVTWSRGKSKIGLRCFDKLQTSVKSGSQVCDCSCVLATQTMSVLNYFAGLRHTQK